MASDKEWLTNNIENGSIRFYSFDDFIDQVCIGGGGYGVVFKAKAKTLDRMVAYKLLHSHDEDEMIENFVKEVGVYSDYFIFGCYRLLKLDNYTFSLRFIVRPMTTLTSFDFSEWARVSIEWLRLRDNYEYDINKPFCYFNQKIR